MKRSSSFLIFTMIFSLSADAVPLLLVSVYFFSSPGLSLYGIQIFKEPLSWLWLVSTDRTFWNSQERICECEVSGEVVMLTSLLSENVTPTDSLRWWHWWPSLDWDFLLLIFRLIDFRKRGFIFHTFKRL